jgi:two-component system sensor histidine kinase UhpB
MDQVTKSYSILIIEDNPGDQLLLEENLKTTSLAIGLITTADTIQKGLALLEKNTYSIIFLDLFLPDSSGLETLTQLVTAYPKTPIIISSGMSDKQIAVKAISMGAQDFLIKGEYPTTLLEKSVSHSMERKDAEQLIKTSEENYRYLFDNNPATIFIWNLDDFQILEVNETAVNLYGYKKEEFLKKTLLEICSKLDHEKLRMVRTSLQKVNHHASGISKQINKNGEVLNMEVSSHKIVYHGKQAVLSLANDITERVLLEEKLLEEKIKKQQEITAAIITTQTQERAFFGVELHDNINQILATANLYLDTALSNEERRVTLIQDSRNIIKMAIEEIRKLSKSLLPPSLGEAGLEEALNVTINNIKRVNDRIKFDFICNIPDESVLNDKLKLGVFRIVQEQLNNIFKHAGASNISIRLDQEEEILHLNVSDNGVGFDTSAKRNGVGLNNIFERADYLDGVATINSSPGNGCQLAVDFKYKKSKARKYASECLA